MRRREFIGLVGCAAAAWPPAARAQQKMRRIGVLMAYAEGDKEAQVWVAAFRDGLEKLGWTENRNVRIDYRWATAHVEQIRQQAKELVAQQPELILSSGSPTTLALVQQTRTIPVVFANLVDPIGQGFVASMSKPGGNVTDSSIWKARSSGNIWSCSRKSRRALPEWRCFTIRTLPLTPTST